AGLMKAALCLERRAVPPSLHFERLNPEIRLGGAALEVPTTLRPFPLARGRRLAAVSGFGFGGTNAHVVLEEAPERPEPARASTAGPVVLGISARDPEALSALAEAVAARLDAGTDLGDAAWSLATTRARLPHRQAVVAESAPNAARLLRAAGRGDDLAGVFRGDAEEGPALAFLFTGQGSQHAGMAAALFAASPEFQAALRAADAAFREVAGEALLPVLLDPARGADLDRTEWTQPALVAFQWALAGLWKARGVEPDVVLGHSVGEIAAAAVAGALDLEDAIRLAHHRGRLMQALPEGAMAALFAPRERVAAIADAHAVAIAAENGPGETVIAGEA